MGFHQRVSDVWGLKVIEKTLQEKEVYHLNLLKQNKTQYNFTKEKGDNQGRGGGWSLNEASSVTGHVCIWETASCLMCLG